MSASTSPHKEAAGWVKFDETEVGEVDGAAPSSEETNSPIKTKTSRSSSGVSSARGSVQSVVNTDESGGPSAAVLSVTEVVDRKKLDTVTTEVPMFRQMSSSRSSSQMDEVNLDGQSPRTTNDHIRGRRFRKLILKCVEDKFENMSI